MLRDKWIGAVLLAYILGFCLFYPQVFVSTDEASYVEQATDLIEGRVDPANVYPPGTALLQMPLVAIAGWRAAAWASVLSMAAAVVMLAAWLRTAGYAPGFALLFVAYAPTLVMGRLATSDVPSAAVVTLGLWLFWTGAGCWWKWLLAGAVAGGSALFRETNVVLFLPFLVSAIYRRERSWIALVAGSIVAVGATPRLRHMVMMVPLLDTSSTGMFSATAALDSGPLYALALLVLVPGGLIAVWLYQGPHRRALQLAVALYVPIYLFYGYSGQDSGGIERIAAGGRYLIPLVPLITLAWADAASRHLRDFRVLVPAAKGAILAIAFAVHPVMQAWGARDAAIVLDIMSATSGGIVLADTSQRKYVSPGYGSITRLWMSETTPARVAELAGLHPTYLVLVSRSENMLMAQRWGIPRNYIAKVANHCRLEGVHDRHYATGAQLQVWRVRACQPGALPPYP